MPRRAQKPRRKRIISRAKCFFCEGGKSPSWRDYGDLGQFTSERGKILSSDRTGICPKHQRRLTRAVKRGRFLALLPFVSQVR